MKTSITLAALALAALTALATLGCGNKSPEGGSPGTDNSFKIAGAETRPSIKQGDTESIKVSVERGRDFHNSVRLEAKAPDKIQASVDRNLIKDGESPEVHVKIHPQDDAPPGDYKVLVTASSDHGTPTNLELNVKVMKR
jgi:uncharacterized membrane protein